jgi:hypothetical protein
MIGLVAGDADGDEEGEIVGVVGTDVETRVAVPTARIIGPGKACVVVCEVDSVTAVAAATAAAAAAAAPW